MDSISLNLATKYEKDSADTVGIMAAKGTAMGVLFIASFATGVLPFLMAHLLAWNIAEPTPRTKRIISMLLGLGGGILLATTFLHLLPEVRNTMADLQAAGAIGATEFPLSELLMCVGFFFIYFISELVYVYLSRRQRQPENKSHDCGCANNDENGNATVERKMSKQHNGHSHVHLTEFDDDTVLVALRGLLIVLALSIHELFEGLALGLESTTPTVWLFFGAIASHKLVLAFCVGMELLVAKTKLRLALSYIFLFALVSPIGIGIGMAVSNLTASAVVGVILQALATGTLVYVVFFEVLKKSGSGILQFAAVIVGFFVMFGLQQIVGHAHGEAEDHSGHSHILHSPAENGHVDHSHMDDLRQKLNILKQAGNLLSQSADISNKDGPN